MKRFDIFRVASLATALALMAGVSHAREVTAPAAKVFPFLREYLSLPLAARDRFAPTYRLLPKLGNPAGARLTLIVDGRRTALSVAADGQIGVPTSAADVARGQVEFSLPPGTKVGVGIDVMAVLPKRSDVSIPALDASLAQANRAMHTGIPLLAPPPFRKVLFPGSEGGEFVGAAGQRSPLSACDGVPCYEPSRAPPATSLIFRQPPPRAVLEADN